MLIDELDQVPFYEVAEGALHPESEPVRLFANIRVDGDTQADTLNLLTRASWFPFLATVSHGAVSDASICTFQEKNGSWIKMRINMQLIAHQYFMEVFRESNGGENGKPKEYQYFIKPLIHFY